MKSLVPLFVFIFGAPLLISLSAVYLFSYAQLQSHPPIPLHISGQVLAAATSSQEALIFPNFIGTYGTADARSHIIKNYLRHFDSPLEPYSQNIVEISDKYSLDYRLLVAIAQQESGLCKHIPENSHNCWGFGIYGDLVTRFDSYPEAMEKVAKTLKHDYVDKGLKTPIQIMAKYTPPSLELGGPWAKGVSQFMTDLE